MYARGVSRDINPAARHTSASWEGVVSLASVLTQVRPAYGGTSWDEALAYLDSEPAESAVVAALCASLLESGAELFESPIRVFRADPDDRPEDGVADFTPNSDGGVWALGNGMHRVAAAVRMGLTTIRCTTVEPGTADTADEEYADVVFRVPEFAHGPDASLDALDWVCGWLRSFPLSDGTWVECDSFGWHGEAMTGLWSCPSSLVDVLVDALRSRFVEHAPADMVEVGGELVVVSVRTVTGAELDAEFEAEFPSETLPA